MTINVFDHSKFARFRDERSLTIEEAASILRCSSTTLATWEAGLTVPKLKHLAIIKVAYKLKSIEDLFVENWQESVAEALRV